MPARNGGYRSGETGYRKLPGRRRNGHHAEPSKQTEMGSRQVPFSGEIWIDRADFREEANKQYKRLVLGKEVRLRNAYVIKAERVEKDAEGNITTIFCTYDADTLSKDPADGRKVKGVIHWVSAAHALPVEIRLYDRLFSVPNRVLRMISCR